MHDLELPPAVQVANDYVDEEAFYYPHNLDFRGRAYPMHPSLNHLGADMSRGLLQFSEAKPLGAGGLRWLEISVSLLAWHGLLHSVWGILDGLSSLPATAKVCLMHTAMSP